MKCKLCGQTEGGMKTGNQEIEVVIKSPSQTLTINFLVMLEDDVICDACWYKGVASLHGHLLEMKEEIEKKESQ